MAAKIFIPQKCRVGFQHRDDTFTKKLAYVIYYDSLGRLRKEASWKSWCHLVDRTDREGKVYQKAIEPYDFDNVPTSGFVLNKGVQRCNWGHFSSGRSMIRIYDPRGVEFEITPDNLIGILMHADCRHREIQCDLVYAWCGSELVLLPCVSDEYRAAANFTALQATKVPVKELKEGATYVTKREEKLVYLGRHMWYEVKDDRRSEERPRRIGSKEHIFCDLEGKNCKPVKSVSSKLAAVADPNCHTEFANWVSAYLASEDSAEIIDWRREPIPDEVWNQDWAVKDKYHWHVSRTAYTEAAGGYCQVTIACGAHFNNHRSVYGQTKCDEPSLYYQQSGTVYSDGAVKSRYYYYNDERAVTAKVVDRSQFFDLIAIYSNGLEKKWS